MMTSCGFVSLLLLLFLAGAYSNSFGPHMPKNGKIKIMRSASKSNDHEIPKYAKPTSKIKFCKLSYVNHLSSLLRVSIPGDLFDLNISNNFATGPPSHKTFVSVGHHTTSRIIDLVVLQLNVSSVNGVECSNVPMKQEKFQSLFHNRTINSHYISDFFAESDWESILTDPKVKFILTKVNVSEWLHERLNSNRNLCQKDDNYISPSQQQDTDFTSSNAILKGLCTLPLPFQLRKDTSIEFLAAIQLKGADLNKIQRAFDIYYEFVSCLIPPKSLHTINTTNISVSTTLADGNSPYTVTQSRLESTDIVVVDDNTASSPNPLQEQVYFAKKQLSTSFWKKIVSFMEIHIPEYTLSRLILGGIPTVKNGECHMGGSKCLMAYSQDKTTKQMLTPSVCAIARNIDLVQVTNPRMLRCASTYADELSAIVGREYRELIYSKMTRNIVWMQYNNSAQIILNIGPGSTGTNSVFTAMRNLNITSRHYSIYSHNCLQLSAIKYRDVFGDKLEPLADERTDRIWWGDLPVPEDWWYIYAQYPEQTKFIMTDMDYDKWYKIRLRDHCMKGHLRPYNGCTPPVAFSFYKQNRHFYNATERKLLTKLVNSLYLPVISANKSTQIFRLYHKVAKCVLPKENLLWLDMSKQKDSKLFWYNLVTFLNMSVNPVAYKQIENAGVPYVSGSKGCFLGGKPCVLDKIFQQDKFNVSAIIPSVCAYDRTVA